MDFVEEELHRAEPPIGGFDATFDGQHVFWFERAEGSTVRCVVDGRAGLPFDGLEQWRGPTVDPIAPDTGPGNWIDQITEFELPITRSPDGNRFAFVAKRDNGYFLQVEGDELHPSDEQLSQVVFGPEGKHVACIAGTGRDARLVVDGEPIERPEGYEVFGAAAWFDKNGDRYAYVAKRGKKFTIILEGQPGPEFDLIAWPDARFDALGRSLYVGETRRGLIRKEKTSTLMRDGETLAEAEEIQMVTPDPSGSRLAFVEGRGDTRWVTLDGRNGPELWNVGGILFSPDGAHVAHYGYRGPREHGPAQGEMFLDEERIAFDFDDVEFSGMAFSQDGQHFCAVVRREGKDVVLVDGEESGSFALALDPVFADDGRLAFRAGHGERESVVVDGSPGPSFDRVLHLRFGAQGGPLSYLALSGKKSQVVLNHEPGPALDGIRTWSLPDAFEPVDYVLSPGGKHVAYVGFIDSAWHPIVDQVLGPAYDAVGPPASTLAGVTFAATRDGVVYRITASSSD